jgi:hypothetical protein
VSVRLAADVKPQFGPTLPQLLEARIGGVPRRLRPIAVAIVALIVAVVLIDGLRGGASTISGGAPGVSFSFSYSGLVREATPPGQYALLASHTATGRLVAQIEVGPLRLPPYSGNVTGIEPVLSANYMRAFAARTPGVTVQSAAPTLVGGSPGYNFTYTREIAGLTYFGRTIFITPSVASGRRGVIVSVLAQPVLSGIIAPGARALAGALYEPGQGGVGVLFQPAGKLSLPLATLHVSR